MFGIPLSWDEMGGRRRIRNSTLRSSRILEGQNYEARLRGVLDFQSFGNCEKTVAVQTRELSILCDPFEIQFVRIKNLTS